MSEAPPLVPAVEGHGTVYIVLDDFGQLGRVYRETDEPSSDARNVIREMVRGEYHRPVRVVAFNVAEGWARDASAEIAAAVAEVANEQGRSLSRPTIEFLHAHLNAADIPSFG